MRSARWVSRVILLAALVQADLFGQGERATVTGAATDKTGAIIIGAKVSIRNIATNVIARTTTNNAGIFYLTSLNPGRYELRVEQTGFRPAVVNDIPLGAGLTATFDVSLEIGSVSEAIEVQANAVQLEAQTTALGKVLQTSTINGLPLIGRNVLQLVSLLPGVTPVGGDTNGDATNAKMSGGFARDNGVLTDGGESRATVNSKSAFTIPMESVAEYRVDTATYAAEFGRAAGGVVNLVTKSGTNVFHGSLYEYFRNDALNANTWTNNRSGVRKGVLRRNEYGGSLGGPIIKNRTFFFANYERSRQSGPIQSLNTVPTPAQRSGDFNGTLDPQSRQVIVYDPNTTRFNPANASQSIRDAFPGNRVPTNRINNVSSNVLKYWPASNRPGEGPAQFNNFFTTGSRITANEIWVLRLDHNLNDKHRLFGRFNGRLSESYSSGLDDSLVALVPQTIATSPAYSALISETSTWTPSLLAELRFSYTRIMNKSEWDGKGFDINSLGFPSSVVAAMGYRPFPNISVSQYTVGTGLSVTSGSSAEVSGLNGANKSQSPQDTWHLQYHVTHLRNRHKFKIGTDLELLRLNTFATNSPAGAYFFDRLYTQGPDALTRTTNGGHGFASFLLGVPVSNRQSFDPALTLYRRFFGVYFQDDIQITKNLTANLGLRYEYQEPWAEKYGRIGYFDFDGIEPVTGAKGTYRFLAPGQFQTDPRRKNFAPRVGLAYRLGSKSVIRVSGGYFYAASDTINAGTSDWGNGLFTLFEGSLGAPSPFPNTPPPGGSWSNPFAAGLPQPDRNSTFSGQNLRTYNRNHPLPIVSNWTFNIQRMLTSTILVQAGYVGNRIMHIVQNRFYNQNNPADLVLGAQLLQQVPNPFFGKITTGNLSFPTVQRRQLLRPYPQYLQVLIPRDGYGDGNYHSAQFQIDKQYSHGLTLSASYTISKTIANVFESDATEAFPQNALYNSRYNRTIEPNDIPQRVVLSYLYDMPFGKGKKFLNNGIAAAVVGNWQMSGITVLQSGTPIRIAGADNTNLYDFSLSVGRGDRIGEPVLASGDKNTQRYFNTSAFAQSPAFSIPTDSLTQPQLRNYGRRNFDIAFIRNQPIKERYNVQLRADITNFFNTPALSLGTGSSVTIGTPQFGQVLTGGAARNIQLALRFTF
ncbi:MAG TPA: carboxypeptidase regulatory-like domain-containing protein [Bryobacteraceae bacterium]|nr:carboxypeptidase regulatory-like domain-containing protein [Bryobacteraceae bacterium]